MSTSNKENKAESTTRIRKIFKNQLGHFRSGWRILFYVIITILLFELSDFLERSFLLIEGEDLNDYTLLQNRLISKFLKLLSVFIPGIILLKFIDKRPTGMLGTGFYKGTFRELCSGMLMGFLIAGISIFVLWMTGLADFKYIGLSSDMFLYLFYCLFILIISASYEEILFRGYIFQSLIEGSKLWISLAVFSILFGLSHLSHGVETIAFAVVSGVFLGLLYYKTRALWMCIGIHFIWNWMQVPIFGMGVEESKFLRRSLFEYQPTDLEILGGAETLTVIVQGLFMIALTFFVWKSAWIKPSEYNKKLWSEYSYKSVNKPEINE